MNFILCCLSFWTEDQRVSQAHISTAISKKQQGHSFGSHIPVSIFKAKINLVITHFLPRQVLIITMLIKRPQNNVYFENLS